MAYKTPVWFHIQTQSAVSRITILLAFQDSRVLVQKVGCQGSNVQFKREKNQDFWWHTKPLILTFIRP
jgi:hypothetical protein